MGSMNNVNAIRRKPEGTDLGLADDENLVRLITVTSNMPDGGVIRLSTYHANF